MAIFDLPDRLSIYDVWAIVLIELNPITQLQKKGGMILYSYAPTTLDVRPKSRTGREIVYANDHQIFDITKVPDILYGLDIVIDQNGFDLDEHYLYYGGSKVLNEDRRHVNYVHSLMISGFTGAPFKMIAYCARKNGNELLGFDTIEFNMCYATQERMVFESRQYQNPQYTLMAYEPVKAGLPIYQTNWKDALPEQGEYDLIASEGSINLYKYDEVQNIPIPGVSFYLYYVAEDDTLMYYQTDFTGETRFVDNTDDATILTTDSGGMINVDDLPFNTYYLLEISAPEQYLVASEPYEVVLENANDGDIEITNAPFTQLLVNNGNFMITNTTANGFRYGNTANAFGNEFFSPFIYLQDHLRAQTYSTSNLTIRDSFYMDAKDINFETGERFTFAFRAKGKTTATSTISNYPTTFIFRSTDIVQQAAFSWSFEQMEETISETEYTTYVYNGTFLNGSDNVNGMNLQITSQEFAGTGTMTAGIFDGDYIDFQWITIAKGTFTASQLESYFNGMADNELNAPQLMKYPVYNNTIPLINAVSGTYYTQSPTSPATPFVWTTTISDNGIRGTQVATAGTNYFSIPCVDNLQSIESTDYYTIIITARCHTNGTANSYNMTIGQREILNNSNSTNTGIRIEIPNDSANLQTYYIVTKATRTSTTNILLSLRAASLNHAVGDWIEIQNVSFRLGSFGEDGAIWRG